MPRVGIGALVGLVFVGFFFLTYTKLTSSQSPPKPTSLTTHRPSPPMLTPQPAPGVQLMLQKRTGGLPNICTLSPPLSRLRAPDAHQGGEGGVRRPGLSDGGRAPGPCAGLDPRFWLSSESHPELDNQTRKEPQRRRGAVAPQAADNCRLSPTDPPSCPRAFRLSPETAVSQGRADLTGQWPSEQAPGPRAVVLLL